MTILKRFFQLFTGVIVLVVLCIIGIVVFLSTDRAQKWLFQEGITMLSEHLQTKVKADSLSVHPLQGKVTLYGFSIEDRNHYPMLGIDTLSAGIAVHRLLDKEVRVTALALYGARATLYKVHKDSAANYQFVADAFKPKHKREKLDAGGKKSKLQVVLDVRNLTIERTCIKWDVCDRQRKNVGRPSRGAFDANHINADINLKAKVKSVSKDSFNIDIKEARINDYASGLYVKHLSTKAMVGYSGLTVKDTEISLKNTHIKIGEVKARYEKTPADTLHHKKGKFNMWFEPFYLTADVVLKDISKPFAPALSYFTTPLTLVTEVKGSLDKVIFSKIKVATPDKRLHLSAKGTMVGVTKGKGALALRFRNIDLDARNNIKEEVIMHFSKKVRLKMIRQMKLIGDVRFLGSLDVLYRKEIINGVLFTKFGNVNTYFTLDGNTHYMYGSLNTSGFEVGQVMNVDGLGPVNCRAEFKFNISRHVKHPASALPNGRLPLGKLTATINDARFKFVHFKEMETVVESDGSTASGSITIPQRLLDIIVHFDYIQTDDQQHLKIKPSLKRHVNPEKQKAKEEKRLQKQQKKEQRKAEKEQRKAEKAQRKAEAALEKAIKKQEKTERKARKKAENIE